MRIAIVANTAWYISNFRLNFMRSLRAAGYEVCAISPPGEGRQALLDAGFAHYSFSMEGKSTNPLKELASVLLLRAALKDAAADIVLTHTPKGNIYTALARRGLGMRQIAGVSGLGSSFIRQDWLTEVVMRLYRLTFGSMDCVFFENRSDRQHFLERGLVVPDRARSIPGLGVDLQHFAAAPLPRASESEYPVFLMVARLLGDKGVREYAQAAAEVKRRFPRARFRLLGGLDASNPTAIGKQELDTWTADRTIDYLGQVADVRPVLATAHCLVLPSYREGMSRTLLEGAAMGRPLIASDVPGCREAIDTGANGWLCQARQVSSLVDAMIAACQTPPAQLQQMGQASRRKAELEFSETTVTAAYLEAIAALGRNAGRAA